MTAPGSGPDETTPHSGHGPRTLALVGILLLAAVCAIPLTAALVSPEFHRNTRHVITGAFSVSALPTVVLAAAASVRQGAGLLLAASGVALVHLVAAAVLLQELGGADAEVAVRATVQLVAAVLGLAVAWWRTYDRRVGPVVAPAIVVAGPVIAVVAPVSTVGLAWWVYFTPYHRWGALPVFGILVLAVWLGMVGQRRASVAPVDAAPTGPDRLAAAGVVLLAAAAALDVPSLFAYGPGIRPGGAGAAVLTAQLVVAAMPCALVLAAGAVASGRRWLLVLASVTAAVLGAGLAASGAGGALPGRDTWVPLVGLVSALSLAWVTAGRPEPVRTRLLRVAALLVVVAAAPWSVLADPRVRLYRDPDWWWVLVEPHLPVLAVVGAAALLGAWSRPARIVAAVIVAAIVVVDLATLLDQALMLRRLTALNGLRLVVHLAVCLLAVRSALAVRGPAPAPWRKAVPVPER